MFFSILFQTMKLD